MIIPATGHIPGDWEYEKDDEGGEWLVRKCSECGEVLERKDASDEFNILYYTESERKFLYDTE